MKVAPRQSSRVPLSGPPDEIVDLPIPPKPPEAEIIIALILCHPSGLEEPLSYGRIDRLTGCGRELAMSTATWARAVGRYPFLRIPTPGGRPGGGTC